MINDSPYTVHPIPKIYLFYGWKLVLFNPYLPLLSLLVVLCFTILHKQEQESQSQRTQHWPGPASVTHQESLTWRVES